MTWNQSQIDALQRLAMTRDQRRLIEQTEHRQIIEARGTGVSWQTIGNMLGCSGEAVRLKHGPKMPARANQAVALF
jgi:hypothetical protein